MRLCHQSDGGSWLLGSLCLLVAGCVGQPNVEPISSDERGLKELAQVYREFNLKSKHAPRALKELKIKGQRNPIAVTMINSGDLVVQWGAPLSADGEARDAVLAYVKTVPERGGYVLMQDGKTIRKMTAEEFKKASKAKNR
jgi:hydrogenase maturation factor